MGTVQSSNQAGPPRNVSAKRVRQRVTDWQHRIDSLYASIAKWLANDPAHSVLASSQVVMDEELMRKNRVSPVKLKVLEIRNKDSNKLILSFVPHGLWIIGANGRLDVIGANGTWILVDESKPLEGPSDWALYSRKPSNKVALFDESALRNLIDAST